VTSRAAATAALDWRLTAFSIHLLVLDALAVVVLALLPGPVPAIGAASVLVMATVVLTDRRPASLSVTLAPSASRCTAGDVVSFRLTWSGDAAADVTGHLEVAPFVELAGPQPWHLVSSHEHSFEIRPTGWLAGSPGNLQLRVVSRYGGWSAPIQFRLPDLIVHPRPERQPGVYAPPELLSQLGVHASRVRGTGTEFADVRPYAAGDAQRDVNWRASARTGELMVSQRYRDHAADVVVLLDHLGRNDAYDRRLVDAAVRGGTAVARAYLAAGDRVGLVLYRSPIRWISPGQGQAQQMRFLDQIVVPPALDSYLDPEVERIPAAALPPRAVVFCFSPLFDARMISAISRLASRGHRLVVVDVAGIEPAEWPPRLSEHTAHVWREHRTLLRARLTEWGAMVVDEPGSVVAAVRAMSRRGVA